MKQFSDMKQIEKYYDKDSNTYVFVKDGKLLDVKFEFELNLNSNIKANNIKAKNIYAQDIDANNINASDIKANNIYAYNINAWDINALDIDAKKILYYGFCIAYSKLKCVSIQGVRCNSIHKCLDNEIEFIKER